MKINHISVSRKRCFDECAQCYKYRYHLKVPRPGEEPFYFTYGNIVHTVAEHYVKRNGEDSLGDIATEVFRGKLPIGQTPDGKDQLAPSTLPPEYQKKLPKHLRAIQKLTDSIGTDGITEHEFYYDLDPPNGRHIKGFIDRLIIKEDKAWIIDYKTTKKGRWRHNKTTITTDVQLSVYARVVQKEFNIKPENIQTALYYVEGGDLIGATFTDETLQKVEQELLNTYKRIEDADPDKVWGTVGWHCKRCDYQEMCPFYKPITQKAASWDGDMSKLP